MKIEAEKIVPVLVSANIGASTDTNSILMDTYHRATFIFTCGACTGDVTFTVTSGATDGAKTTQIPFRYAMGSAAIGSANCDVLSAVATDADGSVALTCTTKMVVIDVESSELASGHKWLTITAAATAGIVHGVAILAPRYSGSESASALA